MAAFFYWGVTPQHPSGQTILAMIAFRKDWEHARQPCQHCQHGQRHIPGASRYPLYVESNTYWVGRAATGGRPYKLALYM